MTDTTDNTRPQRSLDTRVHLSPAKAPSKQKGSRCLTPAASASRASATEGRGSPTRGRSRRPPTRVACASSAPATTSSCRSSASNRRWHETNHSVCSWRAGCGGSRKSGSEGGGEETTGRKADTGASPPTLRKRTLELVRQDGCFAEKQEPTCAPLHRLLRASAATGAGTATSERKRRCSGSCK
jgi:hypothetical protein